MTDGETARKQGVLFLDTFFFALNVDIFGGFLILFHTSGQMGKRLECKEHVFWILLLSEFDNVSSFFDSFIFSLGNDIDGLGSHDSLHYCL